MPFKIGVQVQTPDVDKVEHEVENKSTIMLIFPPVTIETGDSQPLDQSSSPQSCEDKLALPDICYYRPLPTGIAEKGHQGDINHLPFCNHTKIIS